MPGYEIRKLDDMEGIYGGLYKRARAELGVTSFGLGIVDMPPNLDAYPEHDHSTDGQEEVYIVVRGAGEIQIDGESFPLDDETAVAVRSGTKRKIIAGPEGLRFIAIGGTPGEAYAPPDMSQLGAPDPAAA